MKHKKQEISSKQTILNQLITAFTGGFFFVYPIYYRNYYFDVVQCRFYLLTIATGIISLVALGIFFYLLSNKQATWEPLSTLDWFVLALWWANLVSVIGSNYMQTAIVGTPGRRAGLITVTCYLFLYFLISRFYVHADWVYLALFASSVLVSIVAILQFVDMDVLGFYNDIAEKYKETYFTTMGHINVVASFYGILLPMAMVYYLRSTERWRTFVVGAVLVCSMTGLFVIGCESGILIFAFTILAGLLVTPVLAKLYRMFLAFGAALMFWKLLLMWNERTKKPRKLETLQQLVNIPAVFWVVLLALLLLAGGCVLWYHYGTKHGKSLGRKTKWYYFAVLSVTILALAAGLTAMIYFSTVGKKVPLGPFENILRMNESFGSYRGYIWNLVMEEFWDLPLLKKIIGVGCDSLKPFLLVHHQEEMVAVTGFTYDNAHNEFLQYLITTGIFGLAMYISVLVLGIRQGVEGLKEKASSETTMVALFGVLGYLVQSMVDINQCVTTPLFVLVFGITVRRCKKGCPGTDISQINKNLNRDKNLKTVEK